MIIALIPFAVSLLGLVIYCVSVNSKAAELGRLAFAVGLLVALAAVRGALVKL